MNVTFARSFFGIFLAALSLSGRTAAHDRFYDAALCTF